ncbi:MAG: ATP-binding protein [Bryobacterales bacterium]|nr:ATP-binding protein [Bryobacterales bacterium]
MTAKALTGAVSEIINNVWQHAQATSPGLLVYQLEPERVHIGVADMGVGVLNSLRTNPRYSSLTTSMAALKKAMAVGVTRYDEQGHGYGFDTLLRAVADQWGAVRLRTGQAVLEFHSTTDLRHATTGYGVDLPGLQIVFTCGNKPPAAPITL